MGQGDEEYKTGYSYDCFRDIASKFYAGEVDVMADISMTEECKADMLFSNLPQGDKKYYILVPDGSTIEERDLSTLKGKRIGVVADSMEHKFLEQFKADKAVDITIVPTDDVQTAVPMVESGELDAFIYIDSLALDGYHITYYLCSMPFYFAVSKAREDICKDLTPGWLCHNAHCNL